MEVTEPCETSIGDAKTEAVETADAEVSKWKNQKDVGFRKSAE